MKGFLAIVLLNIIPIISSDRFEGIPGFYPLQLVVRGQPAADGQFPYLVAIIFEGRGQECGGSILNNRWILTAAHCLHHNGTDLIELSKIRILAGTNFLNQGGEKYNVTEKFIHEQYDSMKLNDIALLKVDRDISFTNKIAPIEISTEVLPAGGRVTSGGWGQSSKTVLVTNELQFLTMQVVDLVICRHSFPVEPIYDSNICAKPRRGQGTCFGDSGGPLVYNDKLVGLLSWGKKCAGPEPEVYTRVSSFRDWIDRKIAP